jgi:hypothetical protein
MKKVESSKVTVDFTFSAFHPKAECLFMIWQVFWLTPLFSAFPSAGWRTVA